MILPPQKKIVKGSGAEEFSCQYSDPARLAGPKVQQNKKGQRIFLFLSDLFLFFKAGEKRLSAFHSTEYGKNLILIPFKPKEYKEIYRLSVGITLNLRNHLFTPD